MTLCIILIVANVPVYVLLGKLVFGGWTGVAECVECWLNPEFFHFLFRGEDGMIDDVWALLNPVWWLAACVAVVCAEWYVLTGYVL